MISSSKYASHLTFKLLLGFELCLICATGCADIVAYDLVKGGSQNLLAYNNPFRNAFASTDDTFQIHHLGNAPIGENLIDRSAAPPFDDNFGILQPSDPYPFFAAQDIDNSDNPNGSAEATWRFAIGGFDQLKLLIDIAAMGDFESGDRFSFDYALDGGVRQTLFDLNAETSLQQTYTLASGLTRVLNDPLAIDGRLLDNRLQTFQRSIDGTARELDLFFFGSQNGGEEVLAFRNIIVEGERLAPASSVPAPSTLGLIALPLLFWRRWRRYQDREALK
ncbi:hypothetical protein HBA55_11405 [Pseudomaricurvus alkylphenolicus]|uniref:hypothetical protein n=1 Tax=Pseudomaricurvus alkylphenolicus TaxID=1306991 RepID=UPI00141F53DE|nr:hypothetical protein [Pseudomaricurvus alkylphenolicus]NIB40196.1 hypothetical protein [Pseudomaricurvus alkylphenolicus]